MLKWPTATRFLTSLADDLGLHSAPEVSGHDVMAVVSVGVRVWQRVELSARLAIHSRRKLRLLITGEDRLLLCRKEFASTIPNESAQTAGADLALIGND